MIYLAKRNNSDETHRFQVYKSRLGWEATIIGEPIPFIKSKTHYENVINQLLQSYDSLTVSKRLVDYDDQHIVFYNGEYFLLDSNGKILRNDFDNEKRVQFTPNGNIEQIKTISTPDGMMLPNFYANAKPLCDDSILWHAKDVDTGLWVCFDIRNPYIILSENSDPYTSIYDGLCNYHNSI